MVDYVNTSNALRMAHFNEGSHSFTCHPHVGWSHWSVICDI